MMIIIAMENIIIIIIQLNTALFSLFQTQKLTELYREKKRWQKILFKERIATMKLYLIIFHYFWKFFSSFTWINKHIFPHYNNDPIVLFAFVFFFCNSSSTSVDGVKLRLRVHFVDLKFQHYSLTVQRLVVLHLHDFFLIASGKCSAWHWVHRREFPGLRPQ